MRMKFPRCTLILLSISTLMILPSSATEVRQEVGEKSIALAELAGQHDFREILRNAKARVFPSVVFIKVLKESHERGKTNIQHVSGSGVIISADGEILTNWHVVDKAVEIRCLLYDGRYGAAELVGTDKDIDFALIKLKPQPNGALDALPVAQFGRSEELKEGDFVMAMGAPWGLSRSVSLGIVSCTRRYLPEASEYSLWLQTDAAISPGNSGGPLVDTHGLIVGLNTRGVLFGGDMGFSIPAQTIQLFLPQLRKHSRVEWSYSGLQLQPLRDFDKNMYFSATDGVIVAGTDPESPAERSGLKSLDRILSVAGEPLTAMTEEDLPAVRRALGNLTVDAEIIIEIEREGLLQQVKMTPRRKGKVEGEELNCPRWDMTVKMINQFNTPDLFFYRTTGIFVFGVRNPGNAASAGLQEKDILLKIDGVEIKSLDDVRIVHTRLLADMENRHRAVVMILRNGLMRQVILDYAKDIEKH